MTFPIIIRIVIDKYTSRKYTFSIKDEKRGRCLTVNNEPIIWAVVNAIKGQKAENEQLKEKIEALEKKLQ